MTSDTSRHIDSPEPDDKKLWDIIGGFIGYPAVFVAHEMQLFPLLADQPLDSVEICTKLGIAKRPAEALLAICTSLGLLAREDRLYALTSLSRAYLLQDSPTYFGGFLDLVSANSASISIASLKQAMHSNSSQAYDGEEVFEAHAEQAERARAFTLAMHSASMAPALFWPNRVDLAGNRRMLDIGGGSGAHTIGALQRWPELTGIIFDIGPVCDVADEIARQHGLQERIRTQAGDMWNDPFPKADLHFYSQIYHDWPEDKCRFLTEKSFQSLEPGGRLILHEVLYDDDKSGPFIAAASSIGMLTWTEGRQYSGRELTEMLTDTGFTDVNVIPAFSYWSIIVGRKS